jgi:hypothetical protein
MESMVLSDGELLMIEQLCREGELHCAQRASLARRKEDYSSAAYENALKDQYRGLRTKIARLLDEPETEAAGTLAARS